METSVEWKIVIGHRRFTIGHRTVGGEEEDCKIMEEPSDGLDEKQKYGRRYGKRQTSWAFGSGWTALGCIDTNNNNDDDDDDDDKYDDNDDDDDDNNNNIYY